MIERICQRCGKPFYTYPCLIKIGKGKYCSKECGYQLRNRVKIACLNCGKVFNDKPSEVERGRRFCSHYCALKYRNEPPIKTYCLECGKEIITTKYRVSKGAGKYCSIACRDNSLLNRELHSKIMKQKLEDPEFMKKLLKSLHIRPTKPELQLQAILDKHFPQFRYNGDFSLGITLGGLTPDFVNVNGKKEIIEVYGNYWHSREGVSWHQTELGRIMAYNSLGYRCLVIWEGELKSLTEEELVMKIENSFSKNAGR